MLVDAHVHLYGCYDLADALDKAVANFEKAAIEYQLPAESLGVLMLTETVHDDCFGQLLDTVDTGLGAWEFDRTAEDCSLVASRNGRPRLVVVAGRQIITSESLEVLALATTCRFPDGQSLTSLLKNVTQSGAIAVLPWGFGKWWFRRGRIVEQWLRSGACKQLAESSTVFMGDNGGRTWLLGRPQLFDVAAAHGIRILPGSDPLPLASHAGRVGSFGFMLPGELDVRRPAAQLTSFLKTLSQQPPRFGQLTGWWGFCGNQLAMQARKHLLHSPR